MRRGVSKTGLVIVNVIFLLASLVMIITGASIQGSLRNNPSLINRHVSTPASVTTALGVLLFCIALFAHVSVFCRNHAMLLAYSCLLFILIVVELAVGVNGFVTKFRVLQLINDSLRSAEPRYGSDSLASETWNSLQRNLRCCGVNNYTEWFHYFGHSSLPDSCCTNYTINCGSDAIYTANFHQTDCADAINEWVHKHEIFAAIFFPVLVCLKVIALFLSYDHLKVLRNKSYAKIT